MNARPARLALVLALVWACQPSPDSDAPPASGGDEAAATPAVEWEMGSLAEAGIDPEPLARLSERIESGELSNLHSVLIVKDGRLVFEEYYTGTDERRGEALGTVTFDASTLHDLRSVTKSVTSLLVGIAVDSGYVDPGAPVLDVLGRAADPALADKRGLTVEHLLTMTSGLAWDESTYPYTDPRNDETAMDGSESSVDYVLARPLAGEPGDRFGYCGGCTMLLAEVVRRATGRHLDAWAEDVLFAPLGISEYEWLHHRDGLPITASGLRLRPRDLAKIGYLFVNEGRWDGRQVVSSSWVEASTGVRLPLDSISAYGYQWWVDLEPVAGATTPVPVARGNGGQRIYVVRPLDLVAVVTAGNYNSADSRLSEVAFWQHVLPAADSVAAGG